LKKIINNFKSFKKINKKLERYIYKKKEKIIEKGEKNESKIVYGSQKYSPPCAIN